MSSSPTPIRFLTDVSLPSPTAYDQLLVTRGEIYTAYRDSLMFGSMVRNETIQTGIHKDFPNLWKIGSEVHEAGQVLLGTDIETMKRRLYLDTRPRVAHLEVDDIDEILSDYSMRPEFTGEMGRELGEQTEKEIAKMIVLASREAAVSSFPGGGIDQNGTAHIAGALGTANAAGAAAVLAALDGILPVWDRQSIPDDGQRCVAIEPEMWHIVRGLDNVFDSANGGFGHRDVDSVNPQLTQSMAKDQFLWYKGFKIYRSNFVPNEDLSSDVFRPGDFSNTVGMVWHPDCVGFVQKMGVTFASQRDERTGSDFTVAKTLIGGGTLRPNAAIELASA